MKFLHPAERILQSRRLLLRPFEERDAAAVFKNLTGDLEIARLVGREPHRSEEETIRLIQSWIRPSEKHESYTWAIEYKGEAVGSISLVRYVPELGFGELGFCLGRPYWNQTLMSEACEAVLDFLFRKAGFNSLAIRHERGNPAPGCIARRLGMHFEGLLNESDPRHDGSGQFLLYVISAKEWEAKEGLKKGPVPANEAE